MGSNPKTKAEDISKFTYFKKEDIIKAIKEGGRNVSDIYSNLIKLHKNGKRK